MDINMLISTLALIISIIALFITWLIYSKQKDDAITQSFFNDFATFLADAGRKKNDDGLFILTKMKIEAGFLNKDLFDKFQHLLPIIENLNLTESNPNRDDDWKEIIQFLIDSIKKYNPKNSIDPKYFIKNL